MMAPGINNPFFVRPGFGELPVGSVTAFAGTLGAPDSAGAATTVTPQAYVTDPLEAWGWMFCDGRLLRTYDYPELFAVLGYVYGGSGNEFRIPDYRGFFLRGNGNGTGTKNDPDIADRKVPPGGQGQSSGVGSTQSFALQTHAHDYDSAPAPATPSSSGTAAGASTSTSAPTTGPVTEQGQSAVQVSLYETRPINVYVNHIIKFTYGLTPFMRTSV
jgi:microcystin-dependent protein